MKEATGELNMTVVTVVAIAAILAFFYLVIWPTIRVSLSLTTACSSAGNTEMTFKDADGADSITCKGGICTDVATQTTKTCKDNSNNKSGGGN